jgi:outer membrane protein TolC
VADLQYEQQIVRLESSVRIAYLNLISAREGLWVAEQNLDIRQASLANARARVEVGAAAPIELLSAEAEVASNQEQVLVAEAAIATAEDTLRTLIFDPERPDYWQVRINAADAVQSQPREIDVDAAIRTALDGRLDLTAARQELEISDLGLRTARDATRPAVNLQASYATSGTGGTRFQYSGFPPIEVGRDVRSFSSVLGDTFGAAYPQWSVGLNVSYPLGRSAADANLAQQEVGRRQAQLELRQLEIAIVQQVRDAARQVQSSYQRVVVTRAALAASEQQLEAEERRFAAGLSTTLELQVRQGQLSTARTAELNAVIAYNRALIDFERVQKTQ